ncbi:MAG TPA: DUF4861 family protein, partial [Segetibacter sp.]
MNRNFIRQYIVFVVFSLLITACSVTKKQTKRYPLNITNPSAIERADELVILKRELLEQKLGKIADDQFVSVTTKDTTTLTVQLDDLNKDGKWDEAVFLYNFRPNESAQFQLSKTAAPVTDARVRAHVRMRKKN